MKDKLRVLVSGTPESMLPPTLHPILDQVGSDADWMTLWTLFHWDQLNQNAEVEIFDELFNDMERVLDANNVSQDDYTKMYATLEENIDGIAKGVFGIHSQLRQVLGDMPVHHPEKYVMGVDFEPFNADATVFIIEYRDKDACDQFEL